MARPGLDTAKRMLSVYAEQRDAWQPDHERAMECCDLADILGLGNGIYRAISEANRRHATQDLDERKAVEELYQRWTKPGQWILDRVAELEKQEYMVEGAEEFRHNCEEAESVLSEMERAAAVEARVGLRDVNLSPEAADQLERILGDPDYPAPRPAHKPQAVPVADPSLLLRRG